MNKIQLLFGLTIFLFLSSCESDALFRQDQDTPKGWGLKDTLRFRLDKSISTPSDIYIHLRNNQDYPFSNIFLVVSMYAQDSLIEQDTLEFAMAKPNGEWLGTGYSSVKESKLWWKSNWQTTEASPYHFDIAQANRANGLEKGAEQLAGIISVGLSIETSTK